MKKLNRLYERVMKEGVDDFTGLVDAVYVLRKKGKSDIEIKKLLLNNASNYSVHPDYEFDSKDLNKALKESIKSKLLKENNKK